MWRARQTPVVLQSKKYTTALGGGQALLQAARYPAISVLVGISLLRRLDAAVGHESVEAAACAPRAGIHAQGGNAESISELDAAHCVLDVALALIGVRREEGLVRSEARQIQAIAERAALEALQPGVRLIVHLPVQYLDAVEAHL